MRPPPPQYRRLLEAFQIDLRALAAMRIGVGLMLLVDLIDRIKLIRVYYSDEGVTPRSLFLNGAMKYETVYAISGSYWFICTMFIINAVLAFMLMIGFRARLAAAGCLILLWSLITRVPTIGSGGDALTVWTLVWSLFLPISARASVDALLAPPQPHPPRRVANAASAAILLQVAIVYINAFLVKTDSAWRSEFSAVYYFLNSHLSTPIGHALGQYPTICLILTIGTMMLELVGVPLVLLSFEMPRLRMVMVAMFVVWHLGLQACMYVGTFPFQTIVVWPIFLPPMFWNTLGRYRVVRGIVWAWAALLRSIASAISWFPPPRTVWTGCSLAAQRIAAGLLVYVVIVHLFYDIPAAFGRTPSMIRWIPRLKQNWTVMTGAWRHLTQVEVEVDLADGTTRVMHVEDARDGAFSLTLPRTRSLESFWPPGSIWPVESSRATGHRANMMAGAESGDLSVVTAFADYHRRIWNQQHPPEQQIRRMRVYWTVLKILTPEQCSDGVSPDSNLDQRIQRSRVYSWPEPTSKPVNERRSEATRTHSAGT